MLWFRNVSEQEAVEANPQYSQDELRIHVKL